VIYDQPELVESTSTIVLCGLSKLTEFAATVLENDYKIVAYADPTGKYIGEEFRGKPVCSVASIAAEARLISFEEYKISTPHPVERFSLHQGEFNVVTKALHKLDVMALHRLAQRTFADANPLCAAFVDEYVFANFNSRIPHTAEIGAGTTFAYGGIGVVVHKRSKIGRNCVIGQNVTLGGRVRGEPPTIGDNVYIAPGAKCLGGRIGNNVVVGANAVVINEVPDNCVVAGVPARVISTDMSRYAGYFKASRKKG
jgi:serine O-acetyltransferase